MCIANPCLSVLESEILRAARESEEKNLGNYILDQTVLMDIGASGYRSRGNI